MTLEGTKVPEIPGPGLKIINAERPADIYDQIRDSISPQIDNIYRPVNLGLTESQVDFLCKLQSDYNFTAQESVAIVTAYTGTADKLRTFNEAGEYDWRERMAVTSYTDIVDPITAEVNQVPQYTFTFPQGRDDVQVYQESLRLSNDIPIDYRETMQKMSPLNEENLRMQARLVDDLRIATGCRLFLNPIGRKNSEEGFDFGDNLSIHRRFLDGMTNGTLGKAKSTFIRLLANAFLEKEIYRSNLIGAIRTSNEDNGAIIIPVDNIDIDDYHEIGQEHRNLLTPYPPHVSIQNIMRGLKTTKNQFFTDLLIDSGVVNGKAIRELLEEHADGDVLSYEMIKYYIYNYVKANIRETIPDIDIEELNLQSWNKALDLLRRISGDSKFRRRNINFYNSLLSGSYPSENILSSLAI